MSWKNTHPHRWNDVFTTDTHGWTHCQLDYHDPILKIAKYKYNPGEWKDLMITLKGTLREKETHFVRKVKQCGGFVSVERGEAYEGAHSYHIHLPGTLHAPNTIEYKCPFCRDKYKKNGFPYFMSKPHKHYHGAQGFQEKRCHISPRCPNPSNTCHYPSDAIFFGMKDYSIQVYVMNMKKDQTSWKRSEKSVILDHDEFPNEEDYTPESELSYITSFFSQQDLS